MRKRNCDFLISNLPRNRFFMYFDILKNEWLSLVIYGFLFLFSTLPFIIFRYLQLRNISFLASSNNAYIEILASYMPYLLISLPAFLLIGLVLAGLLRVYKRMGWGKGYFRSADFFAGIKENILSSLILTAIFWLTYSLLTYVGVYFLSSSTWIYYFMLAIKGMIIFPLYLFLLYVFAVYRDSVSKKLYVGCAVFLKRFPSLIVASILLEAPFFLLLLSSSYIQLFVPSGYALIYFPLGYLALIMVYNRALDEEVNRESFPDLVNSGLSIHKH